MSGMTDQIGRRRRSATKVGILRAEGCCHEGEYGPRSNHQRYECGGQTVLACHDSATGLRPHRQFENRDTHRSRSFLGRGQHQDARRHRWQLETPCDTIMNWSIP